MTGMLAIVAGVVFFILVVRRLVAGDSDEAFGEVGDSSWSWDADFTNGGGTDHHGSVQHHGSVHDSSGSGSSSDGGWSWGSSDGGSSWDSSSSSDSGSSWF